tara:strand:+ start:1196 stop:1330 length:135 start_codon:yes stop_codon:yes gene_type:complete
VVFELDIEATALDMGAQSDRYTQHFYLPAVSVQHLADIKENNHV